MAILQYEQLKAMGFKSIGKKVQISDKASFYNTSNISIGDNVRIDDFVVLSAGVGGIDIGSHIHIAVFSSLIGAGNISIGDFSNISSRVSIYSSSDDYSGMTMTNPTIPESFKSVVHADVRLGKHVVIGSGSVILPGLILDDGVAVGALSLINKSCEGFSIYAGIPAKKISGRSKELLKLEKDFVDSQLVGKD